MEPRGRERHRWAKPRGRNGRERMSQGGQRASFNRDRDAGGRTALVFIGVWLSQRVRRC